MLGGAAVVAVVVVVLGVVLAACSSGSKHAAARTAVVVVRPVTAAGAPVSGYTVRDGGASDAGCDESSPSARNAGIYVCGSDAQDTVACWVATSATAAAGSVLCLRNPLQHALIRLSYQGTLPAAVTPARSVPLELVLTDGSQCAIRDGGAWDSVAAHPTWQGTYYCTNGTQLYGPRVDQGIYETGALWHVNVVRDQHVTLASVQSAYFVGTAH